MNFKRFAVAVVCLMLVRCSQPSQPGSNLSDQYSIYLTGRVLNNGGSPVANAVANLKGSTLSDTTDANGCYYITEKKNGGVAKTAAASVGDSVEILKDGQVITYLDVVNWIDTLPDVFVVQRNIGGSFLADPIGFGKVEATVTVGSDTTPRTAELWYNEVVQEYSGFVYFVYEANQNYSVYVSVYNTDSVLTGRSATVNFPSIAGNITMPAFDPNNALPGVYAGNDTMVSVNDFIALHAVASDTFGGHIAKWEWSINGGPFVQTSSGDTVIIAPADTNSNYLCVVRVTDNDGLSVTDEMSVNVFHLTPPVLVSPPNGFDTGYYYVELQWDPAPIAEMYYVEIAADSVFSALNFSDTVWSNSFYFDSADTGVPYYWRVKTGFAGHWSDWSEVWKFTRKGGSGPVDTAPVITTQPQSKTVNMGDSVSFTVAAWGTAPLSYKWRKYLDSFDIPGATNATYTIAAVTPADSGYYYVVVTNAAGSVASDWVHLTITSAVSAPIITTQPQSKTVNVGDSVSFTVAASGFPLNYKWQKNGVTIATSASYFIDSARLADSGNYIVVVYNILDTVTSNVVTLTVNPAGSVVPTLISPPDGDTGLSYGDTLRWNAVSGASMYNLQVATDSGFTMIFFQDSTWAYTLELINGLANGTTYYWRVRAKITAGWSAWSQVWRFATKP